MTKQLPRSIRRNRWLGVVGAGGWLVVVGLAGAQSAPVPWDEAVQGDAAAAGIPEAVPLARDVPVYRVSIVGDTVIEDGTITGTEPPCHETDGAVYCNTLGRSVFGPDAANKKFADDIALAAVAGCRLDRYVIRVTGDRNQDGVAAGDYTVNFALYPTCPGAGGTTAITGTTKAFTVPAEHAAEIYEISYAPQSAVDLPSNLYLGVWFSRVDCGIVVGAPALLGYSADRFDYPGYPCTSGLGGYPYAPHASFYAEIYVAGECASGFAGYKNSNDAGGAYSAGARVYFADDIHLGVRTCRMTTYEVTHKGSGFVRVQLHTFLGNDSPSASGLIPDTPSVCFSSGPNPQTCRKGFDPPIPLPETLWVVFQSGASSIGPIRTCQEADPGRTADLYMVHRDGAWTAESFTECYAGFGVTIFCDGQPPIGACCDMNQTDAQGESVCRNALPEMNCPFPELWVESEVCDSVCDEGSQNGMPCMRQADCPGGECQGPFAEPCGYAACCKPDGACENLTQNVCNAIPPLEDPRLFQKGEFCSVGDQHCPFPACLRRVGDCSIARPELGCQDLWCCTDVCEFDRWCCQVAWDEVCLRWVEEFCWDNPLNDSCARPLQVDVNGSAVISNAYASVDVGDGVCCHKELPGSDGRGSVWFNFEATDTSARIHTCNTIPPFKDSLIMVYRDVDPVLTPGDVCGSDADGIACSDDAPGCGGGLLSDVCVTDLTPGETYFVMLAGKTEDDLGIYHLDIESPCTPTVEGPVNDYCHHAETITEGLTPFDLAGATFDCPGPPSALDGCLDGMENDLWYDWTAPCNGQATIETCGGSDALTPDTSLVVYDSCECPPGWPAIQPNGFLACSDFMSSPCLLGSRVTINTERGRCYKIRLGGKRAGNLTITTTCWDCAKGADCDDGLWCNGAEWCSILSHTCLMGTAPCEAAGRPCNEDADTCVCLLDTDCDPRERCVGGVCVGGCPTGPVTFVDPPSGVVDARQPHPPGDSTVLQGIGTIVVAAPEGALATCFALCETNQNPALHPPYPPGFETNDIESMAWNGDGTFTLALKRPITPGEVTTITYTDDGGTATTGRFIAHPANVNGDYQAAAGDILAIVDVLNDIRPGPWGIYSEDIDQSGMARPPDILRVIDLLNAGWLRTVRPVNLGVCP